MKSPALPLQKALVAAWKASDPPVPMYDQVPDNAKPAYVAIFEISTRPAGSEGYEVYEVTAQLHVWINSFGSVEAKAVEQKLCDVLDAEIPIEGFRVQVHDVIGTASGVAQPDRPDAAVTLRYRLQAGRPE